MDAWDEYIFSLEPAEEFLDDLLRLDDEDIIEAITDACVMLRKDPSCSEEEVIQGQVAATIAAIWAGAPYTAGDVVSDYPFIRSLRGSGTEELYEDACQILEAVADEMDVDSFVESLASAE